MRCLRSQIGRIAQLLTNERWQGRTCATNETEVETKEAHEATVLLAKWNIFNNEECANITEQRACKMLWLGELQIQLISKSL